MAKVPDNLNNLPPGKYMWLFDSKTNKDFFLPKIERKPFQPRDRKNRNKYV